MDKRIREAMNAQDLWAEHPAAFWSSNPSTALDQEEVYATLFDVEDDDAMTAEEAWGCLGDEVLE